MSILDFDLNKEAPFDPGYSASVARVSSNLEFLYGAFSSLPSLKQKKFQFQIMYPKILKELDLNASFYLGCLLWAAYLKSLNPKTPIVGNPCEGGVFDDEAFSEVDFLTDFIESGLNRDAKYYINKTYSSNPLYINILKTYREFLELNKGFINTKTVADIKLPSGLKPLNAADLAEILETIKTAVTSDNLVILLNLAGKILNV